MERATAAEKLTTTRLGRKQNTYTHRYRWGAATLDRFERAGPHELAVLEKTSEPWGRVQGADTLPDLLEPNARSVPGRRSERMK